VVDFSVDAFEVLPLELDSPEVELPLEPCVLDLPSVADDVVEVLADDSLFCACFLDSEG
jgi:hypothetical protein